MVCGFFNFIYTYNRSFVSPVLMVVLLQLPDWLPFKGQQWKSDVRLQKTLLHNKCTVRNNLTVEWGWILVKYLMLCRHFILFVLYYLVKHLEMPNVWHVFLQFRTCRQQKWRFLYYHNFYSSLKQTLPKATSSCCLFRMSSS